MKLYYSPASSALASHITCRELDLSVDLVRVNVQEGHRTENGDDYYAINPRGYVPFLTIDSESSLVEGAAILMYLADRDPTRSISAHDGSVDRHELLAWLTFVATEPQRILALFFLPGHLTDVGQAFAETRMHQRLKTLDDRLADNAYLLGNRYTIADAYAFAVLNWIPTYKLPFDLSDYSHLNRYLDSVRSRPAVQTALREEGLVLP